MRIKVTADSTCDLTPEIVSELDITIIPLYINIGDKTLKDTVEIHPADIFDYVDSGSGVCSTAACSIGDYVDLFKKFSPEYDAVIHIDISSDFSVCYQNACIAAADFDNVYVVDSRNLSTGTGHLAMDAVYMAREGKSAEEIVGILKAKTAKLDVSFVIDSLKYLSKGGRCSSIAYLGANMLKLKPCIEVIDGKMEVGKKYRGAFTKCIREYVTDRLKGRDDLDPCRIYCTYAERTPQEAIDAALEAINEYGNFEVVLQSTAGCTISNHCGPVCLGVLFYRK